MIDKSWKLPMWYGRAYLGLVITVFFLLALGGSVRAMKAGLACPDWPLCFGNVIPDYHPQVYFEFIHRLVAGLVGIGTLVLQALLMRSRAPRHLKILASLSLVILLTQVIFGALTVLLLLKSGIVATHLALGAGFFITLLWILLSLSKREGGLSAEPRWLLLWAGFVSLAVFAQILLGGLVAANFAALVCIDFPKCHGEWFPTFAGIIGLHVIHRLGGYTVFVVTLANCLIMRRVAYSPRVRKTAAVLFFHVCGQVGLGIANVLLLTPPLITVLHLAMAMAILAFSVRQLHLLA